MSDDYNYESDSKDSDKEDSNEMEKDAPQALLPKDIFPHDPKPGKKCTFEVVSVNGDEVSVKYSSSEKGDDDDEKNEDDDETVSVAGKDEKDPFSSYDSEEA